MQIMYLRNSTHPVENLSKVWPVCDRIQPPDLSRLNLPSCYSPVLVTGLNV
jgi:hypothetical protein